MNMENTKTLQLTKYPIFRMINSKEVITRSRCRKLSTMVLNEKSCQRMNFEMFSYLYNEKKKTEKLKKRHYQNCGLGRFFLL